MKIGIIGTGNVGKACAIATIIRRCCNELVLVDKNQQLAEAVAIDMQDGAMLSQYMTISAGQFADLRDAALIIITAGINEKEGGATDRNDPKGRLILFHTNAQIYSEIIPLIVKAAPKAVLIVVSDPPDLLSDVARQYAGHDRVLSTGTYLDTLRFRHHLALLLQINPLHIAANVIGEHGNSSVFLWSTVHVSGKPLSELLSEDVAAIKKYVEEDVRYADITMIEGNNFSQFGIGMVCAHLAQMILRDEHSVVTVGSYHPEYDVSFSLPSVIGKNGVERVLMPIMSEEEHAALRYGSEFIKKALQF